MIDLLDNPAPCPASLGDSSYGASEDSSSSGPSPSTNSVPEASGTTSAGPGSTEDHQAETADPYHNYYSQIPDYSAGAEMGPVPRVQSTLSPACWSELTSRIFYGDQQELAGDGVLSPAQMRDFYNYSIGVGHEGFDGRLLSEAFLASGRQDHAITLMAYHSDYLGVFLKTHHFLLRGDGPLPYNYRHYIAIMAAARFQCSYLMELQKREFLYQGGDPKWLRGLEAAPQKLTSLYHINKMMAHRPWVLKKEDFLQLTKKAGWSLAEVVHAVVLLAHFHSLSSFIHGCGITPEVDFDKGHAYLDPGTFNVLGSGGTSSPVAGGSEPISMMSPSPQRPDPPTTPATSTNKSDKTETNGPPGTPTAKSSQGLLRPATHHLNSSLSGAGGVVTSAAPLSASPPKKGASEVELLMATMKNLSETSPIEDPEERKKRFETVASSDDSHEKENRLNATATVSTVLPPEVSPFLSDPEFTYEDFAKRGQVSEMHTFRIQDYSWEEHGYSLVNRLYADVGAYLDEKFKVAQNMTYYTMGGRPYVDTTKFRTAVWNYIQCLYGIRHDDYDYGEVNQLLERPLKSYIKTVCCYPERVTKADYDNVMREFKHSEKVHVNLMIMEAKTQAELLYALRTIMRFIL